jgi:membrane associated rhomboid family serine protease
VTNGPSAKLQGRCFPTVSTFGRIRKSVTARPLPNPAQNLPPPLLETDIMPPRFNIPPVTRILLIALASQSCLSFAIRYRQWSEESDIVIPYLVLVPQLSLIYPWTFLTTTLVENNVFTLGISGLTIFYGGRYLERAWTSAEFAKFLLITSLIPNALCFGILVILFALTRDMRWT